MADLFVRINVGAYVSDVIGRQFEKVKNSHRFENLKKGHRCEVQMSVKYISDMDLRTGCRLEAGRRSESYISTLCIPNMKKNHELLNDEVYHEWTLPHLHCSVTIDLFFILVMKD